MKKYISYFYDLAVSQTARSTYITTFGAGLNAFFGFLFNIIVARSVSPADFGIFAVVMNLVTIFFVVCDIGLSSSVLRYLPQVIRDKKVEEKQKIIKFSFLVALAISGLITAFLIIFSTPMASYILTKKEISLPLVAASFSLIGLTLSVLFVSILQAEQRFVFGVIADSSIIFVKCLLTVILLIVGRLNLINVFIVFSLTSFTGFLLGLFFVSPKFWASKTDLKLAKTLLGFGVWIVLARIASAISSRIDTIMLIRYVHESQVGFYAAAQRMTFLFPVLVNGLTVVITPKFSSLKTKTEALKFMKKSSLLLSTLLVPLVILFIFSPWITVKIFGDVYLPSSAIFRWLILSSFIFIVSAVPVTTIIYFLGESRFFAFNSFLQLFLIFVGNLILIPVLGVIAPAISLAIAYTVSLLASLLVIYIRFKKND